MIAKPIKRNANILILSREHHFGLLFCWKIKQGIRKSIDVGRIKKYVRYFWDSHLHKYFKEEEDYLFSKVTDDKCAKALEQHQQLSSLFRQIGEENRISYDQLSQLAEALELHIRFEERELFPHLEKSMDEQQLRRIGALLQHSHKVEFKDNYPDQFWA